MARQTRKEAFDEAVSEITNIASRRQGRGEKSAIRELKKCYSTRGTIADMNWIVRSYRTGYL